MLSFWVVKHFDVIEDILTGILSGCVGSALDPLSLQQMEEAFSYGIVMAVTWPAHAGFQIVLMQEFLSLMACKLAPLIGMNDHLLLWLATPDSHQQGAQHQIHLHTRLH